MDLDLVFASDCDIKFSLKKISAKIGDFSLRGLLRVVFKPLIRDVPLIGGVQVYFLTPPEIDFDLGGVANALDAPGTQIKSSQFLNLKIMHKCGFARCHLGFGVFFILLHRIQPPIPKTINHANFHKFLMVLFVCLILFVCFSSETIWFVEQNLENSGFVVSEWIDGSGE